MIEESFTKVNTASTTSTATAPSVQLTSSRVLPWICAATACLRARYRMSAYASAPSTTTKITNAK